MTGSRPSERLRGLFENSALLAAGTVAIAVPLGAAFGVVIGKVDVPGRRVLGWLTVGWLFVPLFAGPGGD